MKKRFMFLILALAIGYVGYTFINGKVSGDGDINKPLPIEKNEPKLKIVDINSKTRPYAVVIDNHDAALPHAGLQDAYIVYEVIAEGGITRLISLFKDQNTKLIGPVRSLRHYFIDYALENNAVLVHHGWSPVAKKDISSLKINNLNGLYDKNFWRDNNLYAPHNSFTNMEKITEATNNKKYSLNTDDALLLKYNVKEISFPEDKEVANKVVIKYSSYQETTYEYDSTNKVYNRIRKGKPHKDKITGKQYTAKNIIITKVNNYGLDGTGRQELENVGSGDGYFISNGYSVPITWSKSSRGAKTVYKYLDGKEVIVNDGNTYIQIQPKGQPLTIE